MHRKNTHFRLFAWLKFHAVAERARWPLWLPVLLGCGIGLYFALPMEPPLTAAWAAALAFALLAALLRHRHEPGRAIVAAGLCALALGAGLAGLRTWVVAAPMVSEEIGPVTVVGQVAEVEPLVKGLRLILENVEVQRLNPAATPERLRLTLMGAQPAFEAGDWLRLRAKLSPPPGPAAPGAFDFQRQSYFQGLGGVGFTLGKAEVVGQAPESGVASLGFAFQRFRARLAERVRAQIPGQPGELAVAFTTGTRGAISEAVLEAMRISGLAHLIAISGLHVGLAAGIVFFAVRAVLALMPSVVLRHPVKKYAALCAIAGALFYALIAGATVPTQRAFLMVTLVFAAVLADRQALSMRAVAWAALVILVLSPEALLGASFQMSFAAVVALIAVFEALRRQPWFLPRDLSLAQRVGRYLLGVALTTLVAGLATAVYGAFHFNRVADYSLVANVVAVPLMALWIMPWAVLAFALMPVGWEGFALMPMGWGIEGVVAVAMEVSAWPGAQSLTPAFSTWGLALFTLGGLWAAIWCGHWRYWGALPAVLGLATVGLMPSPDVIIDATGKLAAVRTPQGGYSVSTLSAKRFEREVWLRRAGLEVEQGRWPRAKVGEMQAIRCDAQGCFYGVDDHAVDGRFGGRFGVAFVTLPEALAEDCARARVVVDLTHAVGEDAQNCSANVRIGLEDLARDGAHALYFQENGAVTVETVRAARGDRPWVVGP
ncbi:MAG: ComEC/Rec2 family competence protein [Rhodospirillales bacterium]|nr:ComEC/Rec2 family competence protein [Rhodospirillales bacterium]